ncbi:CAP domain-containing protein [Chloroflexota bacterium]
MYGYRKKTAIIVLMISLAALLLGAFSCGGTVSQEEYDSLIGELSEARSQVAALQSRLTETDTIEPLYAELGAKNEELSREYDELNIIYKGLGTEYKDLEELYGVSLAEIEALKSQYEALTAEYGALNTRYEELEGQYKIVTEGGMEISEGEIEQAIFELINQERRENGIDELLWGKNLHWWAESNSIDMANAGKYVYSDFASWQEVFWAAGYNTLESIAEGALITWKSNTLKYQLNMINKGATYGTVGVHKTGDIYYITYIASVFR